MNLKAESAMIPAEPAKRNRPFSIIDLLCICALIFASIGFAKSISAYDNLPTAIFAGLFPLIALAVPLSMTLHSSWKIFAKFAVFGTAIFIIFVLMRGVEPIALFACLSSLLIFILYFTGSKTVSYRHAFRWSSAVLCAMVLLTPVYLILFPDPRYVRLREVRKQHPVTDISARLIKYQTLAEAEFSFAKPVTTLGTNEELDRLEAWFASCYEHWWVDGLKDIHGAKFEKFVRTPSLSVVAGRPSALHRIPDVEPTPHIPFQLEQQTESGKESSRVKANREKRRFFQEFESQPNWFPDNSFESIHRRAFVNFLHPTGLGYSPAFQKSVRIVPHAFQYPVDSVQHGEMELKLEKLELIGWLGRDTPQVYVLDHLPRMDEISSDKASTRPLDDFETSALDKLKGGEMIVVEEHVNGLRMLGAIRAIENCKSCHDVPRGEILGAFSYFWSRK